MATAKWTTPITIETLLLGADVAPTLKNLAAGARKIQTTAFDNLAGLHLYMDLELKVRFAVAPAAGAYVEIYAVMSLDDTNYADGDDSTDAHPTSLIATIPVKAISTQQVIALPNVPIPPFKFKVQLKNTGGQALTNTDNENLLKARFHSEQVT